MDRRSCIVLTALDATAIPLQELRARPGLPIILYVDLSVAPAREMEFLDA